MPICSRKPERKKLIMLDYKETNIYTNKKLSKQAIKDEIYTNQSDEYVSKSASELKIEVTQLK